MQTLFIGQQLIYCDVINSTNSYANEVLQQKNLIEGTVIYSFNQIKGRGQRGNNWESKPNKNLALSLILQPSFIAPSKQFYLSKIISLALADLMAYIIKKADKMLAVKIKWPNDIYINDKKVAGILIENNATQKSINHSIIGIGINVNQSKFNTANAVSIVNVIGEEYDLEELVKEVCSFIESYYLQLKSHKLEDIDKQYAQALYGINQWRYFEDNNGQFEGKIKGVSQIGELLLEDKSNNIKEFDLKQIKFLP